MKVLLIQPPVLDFYQTAIRTQPIGLAYIASRLIQNSYEVVILDCMKTDRRRTAPLPKGSSFIKKFYPEGDISPFRLHSAFFHFGMTWDEIAKSVEEINPDVVGVSCQFTPYCNEALKVCSIVKSFNSRIPVVTGGTHASALPETLLKTETVDYIVLGEGEERFLKLLGRIKEEADPSDIEGIGFMQNGSIRINPLKVFIEKLDELPFPARELLDLSRYRVNNEPYTMLVTSRGCPRLCSYCSVKTVMGTEYRIRSSDNIIQEIRYCVERFGINIFDIEDDNFTFDNKRALKILDDICCEFGENRLKLFAMNGLSVASLNKNMLEKMNRAGFQRLDLSMGSSSDSVNRRVNRITSAEKTDSVLKESFKTGLPVTTYTILGIPGQDIDEMIESVVFLTQRPVFIGPSVFYPSPGTEFFDPFINTDFPLLRSTLISAETEQFSRLDIVTLLRLCRWINFIKKQMADDAVPERSIEEIAEKTLPVISGLKEENGVLSIEIKEPLTAGFTGRALTGLFFRNSCFYAVRRIKPGIKNRYLYNFFACKTSGSVIDRFMQNRQDITFRSPVPGQA